MDDKKQDSTVYRVVVNHEEQYSIWPAYKEIPGGWSHVGKERTRARMPCLYRGDLEGYKSLSPAEVHSTGRRRPAGGGPSAQCSREP